MKDKLFKIIVIVCAVAICYLIFEKFFGSSNDEWQRKIDRHAAIADSLHNVVKEIDQRVYRRDSLLVSYIATLNVTLVELDKEARKDRARIDSNERKQADALKTYCEQMRKLNKPAFCN